MIVLALTFRIANFPPAFALCAVNILNDGFLVNGARASAPLTSMVTIVKHLQATPDQIQMKLGRPFEP